MFSINILSDKIDVLNFLIQNDTNFSYEVSMVGEN